MTQRRHTAAEPFETHCADGIHHTSFCARAETDSPYQFPRKLDHPRDSRTGRPRVLSRSAAVRSPPIQPLAANVRLHTTNSPPLTNARPVPTAKGDRIKSGAEAVTSSRNRNGIAQRTRPRYAGRTESPAHMLKSIHHRIFPVTDSPRGSHQNPIAPTPYSRFAEA